MAVVVNNKVMAHAGTWPGAGGILAKQAIERQRTSHRVPDSGLSARGWGWAGTRVGDVPSLAGKRRKSHRHYGNAESAHPRTRRRRHRSAVQGKNVRARN